MTWCHGGCGQLIGVVVRSFQFAFVPRIFQLVLAGLSRPNSALRDGDLEDLTTLLALDFLSSVLVCHFEIGEAVVT